MIHSLVLDVDGVFADFNSGFSQLLATIAGERRHTEPFIPHTWNWAAEYYLPSEIERAWRHVTTERHWWANLRSYPHTAASIGALKMLMQMPDAPQVTFLTCRPGVRAAAQTIDWFTQRGLDAPQVIVAENAAHKADLVWALRGDVFVDDHVENHHAVNAHGSRMAVTQVVVTQPYNVNIRHGYEQVAPEDLADVFHLIREGLPVTSLTK